MTILQALDRYYDRMAARGEAEAAGTSREKIGLCVCLAADGAVSEIIDLHERSGRKAQPRLLAVPAAVKRTVAILPNRFWDKTARRRWARNTKTSRRCGRARSLAPCSAAPPIPEPGSRP